MAERVIPGGGRARGGESRAPGRRPAVAAPTRVRPRIVPVAFLAALACVATPVGTRRQLPVIDTLNSVRLHGEDFATAQGRIQALQALSESAEGRMQALQVGNMMAAEQLQQLVQLRQLVMAQINAQNVYMAAQTNREAQRAATQS